MLKDGRLVVSGGESEVRGVVPVVMLPVNGWLGNSQDYGADRRISPPQHCPHFAPNAFRRGEGYTNGSKSLKHAWVPVLDQLELMHGVVSRLLGHLLEVLAVAQAAERVPLALGYDTPVTVPER